MHLIELLSEDRILLDLPGETVREVAAPLMHAVVESGRATDPDRLDELVAESLPSEAVTVGQRAFLLHFRSEAVEELTAVLGVTAEPVHREHDATKESRLVALVLAPPGVGPAFVSTLSAFARALQDEEIVSALEQARSADDVFAIRPLNTITISGELLVRDVLIPGAVSAPPETTLNEAWTLMRRHKVASLPIVSDERAVLGIVTSRELLRQLLPALAKRKSRAYARRRNVEDTRETPVREVMDRSVLCISEDQTLADVAALLVNKNLERVPVVREGALVGILTRETIVRRLVGP